MHRYNVVVNPTTIRSRPRRHSTKQNKNKNKKQKTSFIGKTIGGIHRKIKNFPSLSYTDNRNKYTTIDHLCSFNAI